MNSHDGAVCGSMDGAKILLLDGCCETVANCDGTDVGGISGDEARVVPDHNEGTGEDGDARTGKGSHSLIDMDGILLLAEKLPRSRSSAVKEAGMVVSRLRCGGGLCQSNVVGVETIKL